MTEKPTVGAYMTRDVQTVSPDDTVAEVSRRIAESEGHNGFPVTEGRRVQGFVNARDLLLAPDGAAIFTVMTTDLVVAHPDMDVRDAARVILRSGIQKLPVVDDADNLVGIITNADVVRSQIERATPEKVGKLMRTLERIHGIEASEERRSVAIDELVPTQERVYADELEGRIYELERGLAEPLVVIDAPEAGSQAKRTPRNDRILLLADGHHRAMAARRTGIDEIEAYVILIDEAIDLGMRKTAEEAGLRGVDDIEVVDYARHPLVESVTRLQ